jgi:dTMP kinase
MSFFITFEGIEGAGKTTQLRLVQEYLEKRGFLLQVVREPGGTWMGDRIRELLLYSQETDIHPKTEILLYAASRAQLVAEVIRPALKQKQLVLCDRYIDSSIAYQGYGAEGHLQDVIQINQIATGGLMPHRTYLLDLPLELSQERLRHRGKKKDRMEQREESFHRRVREGYLQLAQENQQRIKVISADQPTENVFQAIISDLMSLLEKNIKISPR